MIERYTKTLAHTNGIWSTLHKGEISYPDHWNSDMFHIEDESFWFNHRNQVIRTIAQKHITKGIIFDIGGGNGYVSKMLMENGYTPVLVEPGSEGIVNAKERGIKHLIHARFEDAGFLNESIDNAGLFDVVEHIKDDDLFMKNIHQSLKNNGKVILTVPSFQFLWSKVDEESGHFRRYSKKQMKKLLENSGFRVLYANNFFSFLVVPIFLFRTLPSIIFKRKQKIFKSNKAEHSPTSKPLSKINSALCKAELKSLKKGRKIFWGSSCIVVGEKVPVT
ncbi:MAG: class I SAM-dependent methyltransferase [Prolixibacteraceae bacterium]|nr:class I SAM-dependent methyltransferase [Prolixibacteraceae bacterium]